MFASLLIASLVAGLGEAATQPLTVKVFEGDSDRLVPCRVSLRSEAGAWAFPVATGPGASVVRYERKAMTDPSVVEMHATVSAHPFRYDLPPGRYTLTVERGKEYRRQAIAVEVAGEPRTIEVRLVRWIDAAGMGWYSGDTHAHRPLAELPNLVMAEDLNMTFPMTDWVREAFVPPIQVREAGVRDPGADSIRVDATHWIVPRNTEYELFTVNKTSHTLGAFFVLNHKTPLDLGAPPFGPVAERAHREGALIELDKHNWPWSMALIPVMPVDLFELANNHVWQTDFAIRNFGESPAPYMNIERDAKGGFTERGWIDYGFQNYYALLNCGFLLRPTAGTGSGVHPVPLGFGRVYVKLDLDFDANAWIAGLDAGRSFVTTGPMLFATLDGKDPGHRFVLAEPAPSYRLGGRIMGVEPLATVEIIVNGEVARTIRPANRRDASGVYVEPLDTDLKLDDSAWVAVRAFEQRADGRVRFAHSGWFFVDVKDRPIRPRKVEVDYLIRRVEEQIARSRDVLPAAAIDEYRRALDAYKAIATHAR